MVLITNMSEDKLKQAEQVEGSKKHPSKKCSQQNTGDGGIFSSLWKWFWGYQATSEAANLKSTSANQNTVKSSSVGCSDIEKLDMYESDTKESDTDKSNILQDGSITSGNTMAQPLKVSEFKNSDNCNNLS